MATVQRYNGTYPNYVTGTAKYTSDVRFYLIRLRSTSNGGNTDIDLQGEDGDNSNGTETDQIVELVVKELAPLAYYVPSAGNGYIHVAMHGHNVDATSIETRIQNISGVGTDTTVAVGTAFTVS